MAEDAAMLGVRVVKGIGPLLGVVVVAGPLALLQAEPPTDSKITIENKLKVQAAMLQARDLLREGNAARAVEVLEGELSRIDGHRPYLMLLRDAYRSHVTALFLINQPALAQKYLERLRILDPQLADELGKKPAGSAISATGFGKNEPLYASQPIKARGVSAERFDDPFDKANQLPASAPVRGGAPSKTGSAQAADLLAQAELRFNERRYGEARLLFQQAHQLDPALVEPCKERWAYCKLFHAVEQLKNPNLTVAACQELDQEIRSAMALAPRLNTTSLRLLAQVAQRQQTLSSAGGNALGGPLLEMSVHHLPNQIQGWQVAETAYFRIFHNQHRGLVEQAATIAERTRVEVLHKWFDGEGEAWRNKCDIYLHATADAYTRATGVPGHSPGHSRIESDIRSGTVVKRRMELRCDHPDLLTAVLPHEVTHMVLAGQFGSHAVPRWVDEGVAVLSEPPHKVEQQRRNLGRVLKQREQIPLRKLMEQDDFPSSRQLTAFFAQSVTLVEFLMGLRGPVVFSQFVRDALSSGYENALRRHYQINDYADLQTRLDRHLQASNSSQLPAFAGR